ncbi:MAG: hypothetical protein H0X45_14975 [Planctomycetes bacterium]|nr:hypothetical protein [Planctomycetota bacterium]
MHLVAGDGYEALVVRPGPVPRIERAWLPPPAVVARHLPPWSLSVQRDGADWIMQERGLPLASLIACQAAGMGCLMQDQWHRDIHSSYEAQDDADVRLRHAPVMAALERLADQRLRAPGALLSSSPAAAVATGLLSAADLAIVRASIEAARIAWPEAGELWDADAKLHQPLWAVPIEHHWWACVAASGQFVGVTHDPHILDPKRNASLTIGVKAVVRSLPNAPAERPEADDF